MEKSKAIHKIRNIVDQVKVAMMTTLSPNQTHLKSRPMQVAQVDEDAAMWFFTDEFSGKTESLKSDNPVSLTFSNPEKRVYLALSGRAYLVEDEKLASLLWNPVLNTWFPGKQRQHLLMIKFIPESAEYWEEEGSAWKRIFYAGKALVTGDSFKNGPHETASFH